MFYVETNRYSHGGSSFGRRVSSHASLDEAIKAADALWSTGHRRWVTVANDAGRDVYNAAAQAVIVQG